MEMVELSSKIRKTLIGAKISKGAASDSSPDGENCLAELCHFEFVLCDLGAKISCLDGLGSCQLLGLDYIVFIAK